MANREAGEVGRTDQTPACTRDEHGECPHMLGVGGGFNPDRLRFEWGVGLCACDCHAACPVTSSTRRSVGPQAWRDSCTCPGAEAERAQARLRAQARQEAFDAARAGAPGKSRREISDLYVAELRARGQRVPPQEVLDANVAALAGERPSAIRVMSQLVAGAVKGRRR